jgi:hypothetical protein
MDLRRATPMAATGAWGRPPAAAFPGHEGALLVAPGEPHRSLLALRAKLEGPGAMPPHRRSLDSAGARLLDDWIRALAPCEGAP